MSTTLGLDLLRLHALSSDYLLYIRSFIKSSSACFYRYMLVLSHASLLYRLGVKIIRELVCHARLLADAIFERSWKPETPMLCC